MRKPFPWLVISVSLLALTAGCHSRSAARHRHHDIPGSFADLGARAAYVSQRTKELADKGLSKEEAAGRASREWFARAPTTRESPTPRELERRAAQSAFEADLAKQQKNSNPR